MPAPDAPASPLRPSDARDSQPAAAHGEARPSADASEGLDSAASGEADAAPLGATVVNFFSALGRSRERLSSAFGCGRRSFVGVTGSRALSEEGLAFIHPNSAGVEMETSIAEFPVPALPGEKLMLGPLRTLP